MPTNEIPTPTLAIWTSEDQVNAVNFWRAVQLTVVCVPNSGYVSDPPVSDSHPDDHAARHALSRALRCDRCVSLSLVVSEARLRCDRTSPSPRQSQKQDAVSREHGPLIVAAVGPPWFLKRGNVCLAYPLSLSLSAPSQAPLPAFPQRGLKLVCSITISHKLQLALYTW